MSLFYDRMSEKMAKMKQSWERVRISEWRQQPGREETVERTTFPNSHLSASDALATGAPETLDNEGPSAAHQHHH